MIDAKEGFVSKRLTGMAVAEAMKRLSIARYRDTLGYKLAKASPARRKTKK